MTSADPMPDGGPDPRIALAIRLIEDAHFDVPTVAQLAAAVELSPDYFLRRFRDATGRTPIEYVRDNRLDQAAFRLGVTTDSVADLFTDFGYGSQAAFTRAFTRRHGLSPNAYRNVVRKSRVPSSESLEVRVGPLASRACWARRYLGGFESRSEHWANLFQRLPRGLREASTFLGLNHDDPRIRPPHERRYDCCCSPKRALKPAEEEDLRLQGFEPFLTTAGTYAVTAYVGSADGIGQAYRDLIAAWLPNQDRYQIAGEPIIELLTTPALEPASPAFQIDLGIKVTRREGGADWTAGRDQRIAAGGPRLPAKSRRKPE